MKRKTQDEWGTIRQRWEADPREGYTWIVSEMNLELSAVSVLKKAKKEGWSKKASLKSIVHRAHEIADVKVSGKASKVSVKVSALTFNESADLRAGVIETHRGEWQSHRGAFAIEKMLGDDGMEVSRVAKTAAEAIRIRQDGERKAWGLGRYRGTRHGRRIDPRRARRDVCRSHATL